MINQTQASAPFSIKTTHLSLSERVVYWTIVLTPLWWILGIQPIFYPLVVAGLVLFHFRLDRIIHEKLPACIWAWLAMAIVMVWTAMLGLYDMNAGLMQMIAACVTFIKSYFLIFSCLVLPFWSRVRLQVIVRAVVWMVNGYLVTIAVEVALLAVGITGSVTPVLARLIPADKGSLQIILAHHSSFLGLPIPRTVLYTPDPPILGLSSILCFLICLGESNPRLRKVALVSCVLAMVMSASRSALVFFPVALLIGMGFNSGLFRQLSLWLTSLTLLVCSIFGMTIEELIQKPVEAFTKARADSSKERALVVRKTLEAWLESPWVGWGVIRGTVNLYEDAYITLGSFSTYAAVLYLHGIVGFMTLIIAMISTLWAVYNPAIEGNRSCKWAFASLVVLYILCNATPLSWMAVYLWFFFLWLGAVIQEIQEDKSAFYGWEQIAGQNRLTIP